MPTTREEVQGFVRYATEHLDNGGAHHTIEELFEMWRYENPSQEQYDRDFASVMASIEDYRNGERGRPVDPDSTELRRKLGLDGL
jgi:hypothetical protein